MRPVSGRWSRGHRRAQCGAPCDRGGARVLGRRFRNRCARRRGRRRRRRGGLGRSGCSGGARRGGLFRRRPGVGAQHVVPPGQLRAAGAERADARPLPRPPHAGTAAFELASTIRTRRSGSSRSGPWPCRGIAYPLSPCWLPPGRPTRCGPLPWTRWWPPAARPRTSRWRASRGSPVRPCGRAWTRSPNSGRPRPWRRPRSARAISPCPLTR